MALDFMTCTGMYGSGAGIGMALMAPRLLLIRQARLRGLGAWYAAAAGLFPPVFCALRSGASAFRLSGTLALASASRAPSFQAQAKQGTQASRGKSGANAPDAVAQGKGKRNIKGGCRGRFAPCMQ